MDWVIELLPDFGKPLSVSWFCYWGFLLSVISTDITKTLVFRNFRRHVDFKVFKCSYCLCHWFAFGVCLIYWVHILWAFVLVAVAVVPMLLTSLLLVVLEKPELQDPQCNRKGVYK